MSTYPDGQLKVRFREPSTYAGSQVLQKPVSWVVTANKGQMVRQSPNRGWRDREDSITVQFGEVTAWHTSGPVFYAAEALHSIFDDKTLYLDHSLVHSMLEGAQGTPLGESAKRLADEQVAAIGRLTGANFKRRRIEGTAYVACNAGSGTWGHWLVHNLPRVLLFSDTFNDGLIVVPAAYRGNRYRACLEVLELAGVPGSKIVFAAQNEVLEVERAVLIDLPYASGVPHPLVFEQFQQLRRALDVALGSAQAHERSRLHILRTVASREVANYQELRDILDRFDFDSVSVGGLSLLDQARSWRGREATLATLGSDLTNMLLGNTSRICCVSPTWFGDRFFYWIAAALGLEWNELECGTIVEERKPLHRSSFAISPETLHDFLSRLFN